MKKPDFFIVGEPKSGTTALYTYLKQHPDIFMPKIKEPYYFCKDFHKESDEYNKKMKYFFRKSFPFRTDEQYLKLFKSWKEQKISGEASVTYLYSKIAAKEIHLFNPDAKIIMILRNPVDFLHSLHSRFFVTRNETETFENALAAEEERKKGRAIPKIAYLPPSYFNYSEWTKYAEHIQRYYDLFDKKQIKIIIFDDFKTNTQEVYEEVLEFLDVDPNFKPTFEIVNENRKLIPIFRPIVDFIRQYNVFKAIMPRNAYYKLSRAFYKTIVTKQPRQPMNSELRQRLMKEYKPEVEKLSKLINRDLITLWGYNTI